MLGIVDHGNRIIGAIACLALTACLTSCGGSEAARQPGDSEPDQSASSLTAQGAVGVFMPDDGITFSQSTPLNKWTKLRSAVVSSLKEQGFKDTAVSSVGSRSLDDQVDAIERYVDERLDADDDGSTATLVVAPVAEADEVTRQYGDYVTQALDADDQDRTGGNADSSAGEGADGDGSADDDVTRLASVLDKARDSGLPVVLVANTIDGFTPDVFVSLSSAYEIGLTQAQQLADKLALDHATADSPKAVEIMLPMSEDDEFMRDMFRGIWQVLGPYYQSGAVVSPSGKLGRTSDENSWQAVSFESEGHDDIVGELNSRLGLGGGGELPALDGVLAGNDLVASAVVGALTSAGYTGSAADVNPEITIGGIVDNIAGNKDLKKQSVPAPQKTTGAGDDEVEGHDDASGVGDDNDVPWPIITGFGAYLSNIEDVVNGLQWSTGLEDRNLYADDVAAVCMLLNAGRRVDGGDGSGAVDGLHTGITVTTDMGNDTVPTISESLVGVSASNLKKTLIDTGYVSAADAGL